MRFLFCFVVLSYTGGCHPTVPENTHSDVPQIEQTNSENLLFMIKLFIFIIKKKRRRRTWRQHLKWGLLSNSFLSVDSFQKRILSTSHLKGLIISQIIFDKAVEYSRLNRSHVSPGYPGFTHLIQCGTSDSPGTYWLIQLQLLRTRSFYGWSDTLTALEMTKTMNQKCG